MGRYAEGTTVAAGKSMDEIEKTIRRYGGADIRFGKEDARIIVAFRLKGVNLLVEQPLPLAGKTQLTTVQFEKEIRRRWRVLLLRIKSRLEAIEEGESVEEAFMPYILGAQGRTLGAMLVPTLQQFKDSGVLPPLLAGPKE